MNTTKTYVLFGEREAVGFYKTSLTMLLEIKPVINYKVVQFRENEMASFYKENEKWEDFIEISYDDYKKIKRHLKPPQFDRVRQLFNFLV